MQLTLFTTFCLLYLSLFAWLLNGTRNLFLIVLRKICYRLLFVWYLRKDGRECIVFGNLVVDNENWRCVFIMLLFSLWGFCLAPYGVFFFYHLIFLAARAECLSVFASWFLMYVDKFLCSRSSASEFFNYIKLCTVNKRKFRGNWSWGTRSYKNSEMYSYIRYLVPLSLWLLLHGDCSCTDRKNVI